MIKNLSLILFLSCITGDIFCQNSFYREFPFNSFYKAYSFIKEPNGKFLLAGYGDWHTSSFASLSNNGNFEWAGDYDFEGQTDYLIKSIYINDTTFLFAGANENQFGPNINRDINLLLTDENGNKKWAKSYGYTGVYEFLTDGIKMNDSTILFCGRTFNLANSNPIFFEVDLNGNILWSKRFLGNFGPIALIANTDGGFTAAGVENSTIVISRFDSLGNNLFKKNFGIDTSGGRRLWGEFLFKRNANGDFYLCWDTEIPSTSTVQIAILKLDSAYNLLWAKNVNVNPSFRVWELRDFLLDYNDDPIIIEKNVTQSGNFDDFIRMDANATVLHAERTSLNFVYDKAVMVNNYQFYAYGVYNNTTGFLTSLDSNGVNHCLTAPSVANTTDIFLNASIDTLTELTSNLLSGDYFSEENFYQISFSDSCETMGIGNQGNLPLSVGIYYSDLSGNIVIENSRMGKEQIQLFDMQGKQILQKSVNGEQQTRTEINVRELSAGIYLCRVTTQDGIENKKLLIQ